MFEKNGFYYNEMKAKHKNAYLNKAYFTMLLDMLISMYKWDNLPNTIPAEWIEKYLILYGVCGVGNINGKLTAVMGGLCGDVDGYGIGTQFVGATPIGDINGKRGEDVAVGFNNSLYMPDMLLTKFADGLTEIAKSYDLNIRYARLMPMPVVRDNKDKIAIDSALDRLQNGEMKTTVKIDSFYDPIIQDKNDIPVLNLSDVSKIDKLQYLSLAFDDQIRRIANIYGQSLQTTAKNRQALSDEIHGNDSLSFILPLDRLRQRQKFAAEINNIFGTDITVDFSECWKIEYEKFKKSNEMAGESDVLSTPNNNSGDNDGDSAD